jgi:hypothetical protein
LTLRAGERYDEFVVTLGPNQSLELVDSVIELVPKVKVQVRTRKPRKAQILDEAGNPYQMTPWTEYVSQSAAPRKLTLRHEDYEDYPFELGPAVELPRKIEMVKIPEWKVESKPKKAQIVGADGTVLGVTPMRFKVPRDPGRVQLTLRSPGYDDLPVTLLNGEKPPRRFTLTKLPSVTIATRPKRAGVYTTGGEELGQTPVKVAFGKDKRPLSLVIKKSGYKDYPLDIAYGEKPPRRIELTALETTIELESKPKGVDVIVAAGPKQGQKLGQTPLLIGFRDGDSAMQLTLRKSGYADKSVTVGANQRPGRVTLERLAVIKLESRPSGATVHDAAGNQLGKTPFTTEVARSRDKLAFKLALAGYEPKTVTVVPSRDRKERVRLAEEPQEVTVEIVSDPPGAEVYVKNNKVGVTPYKVTRVESSGRTRYSIRMKGHIREEARVRNSENKRVEVTLEKCDESDKPAMVTGIVNPYANSSKCD